MWNYQRVYQVYLQHIDGCRGPQILQGVLLWSLPAEELVPGPRCQWSEYEKGWNDHGSFWWFDHPGWECQWRWELNMMFTTQNGMLNKKTWISFVKFCGTGTCAWTQTVTQSSWTQWYPVIRVDAYVYLASNFVDICLSSQDRMWFGTVLSPILPEGDFEHLRSILNWKIWCSPRHVVNHAGGFKHCLCSIIYGIILPID